MRQPPSRRRNLPIWSGRTTVPFVNVAVVAGQGEISSLGCRDLVLNGCVDILNVDATIAGGLTEWRRAATFARMMNVQMGHHEEPQVAIHLLASVPNLNLLPAASRPSPRPSPVYGVRCGAAALSAASARAIEVRACAAA